VVSGTLDDPYTGQTINFVRGRTTSAKVQIDHVVALENAWQSGANKWPATKRHEFGNDPYNLLAVNGPANQEKGSASAAYWLPTNSE
ncbi:HNH endonuclease family protein, partial [Bifidobacterium breve]